MASLWWQDFIEGLAEVYGDCFDLLFVVESLCQVVHGGNQQTLIRTFSKAVRLIGENVVGLWIMVDDLAVDDVLHNLAAHWC